MDEKVGSLEELGLLCEGIDYMSGGYYCFGELALQLSSMSDKWNPERLAIFVIGLRSLSEKAKHVVALCLDCPDDLEKFIMDKENITYITVNDIRNFLRFNGWSYSEINCSFDEIKNFLNLI